MVRATPSPRPGIEYALVPMGGNPTEQHDPADRFIDDLAFAVVRERLNQVFEAHNLAHPIDVVPRPSCPPEPNRRPYDSYRYEALVTGQDR